MLKIVKPMALILALLIILLGGITVAGTVTLHASGAQNEAPAQEPPEQEVKEKAADSGSSDFATVGKAFGAALAIGLAALGGAHAMGNAIAKASDGIARQPEADGKIRTVLMLGLVFIETVVIYALIASILIIFVM